MKAGIAHEQRLTIRIEGEPAELAGLRSALSDWLTNVGVSDEPKGELVLATHEMAAEAIERGAGEVALLGEVVSDAVRLTMAGGDWSSLDALRSTLVLALVAEIRIHRGIITIRLKLSDTSGGIDSASALAQDKHAAVIPHEKEQHEAAASPRSTLKG